MPTRGRNLLTEEPMNLASEVFTWEHAGRLYSRVTTNVVARRFLARLAALDLLKSAESVHAIFDDRVYGGNGYELLWKEHVLWDDLAELVRL